jgi:hypothetical protein
MADPSCRDEVNSCLRYLTNPHEILETYQGWGRKGAKVSGRAFLTLETNMAPLHAPTCPVSVAGGNGLLHGIHRSQLCSEIEASPSSTTTSSSNVMMGARGRVGKWTAALCELLGEKQGRQRRSYRKTCSFNPWPGSSFPRSSTSLPSETEQTTTGKVPSVWRGADCQ